MGGRAAAPLAGRALMCGFYLNELFCACCRDDAHEALFDSYGEALAALSAGAASTPC